MPITGPIEARVHPALCQVPAGSRVLLIGGGIFGTLSEANSRLDEIFGKGQNKLNPRTITVSGWLDYWLAASQYTKKLRHSTLTGYTRHVEKYIKPELGKKHLQDLRSRDIRDFHGTLLDKGLAGPTVRRVHATLRRALRDAVEGLDDRVESLLHDLLRLQLGKPDFFRNGPYDFFLGHVSFLPCESAWARLLPDP